MDREAKKIISDLEKTVGNLSDLRYGHFRKGVGEGDLKEEVIDGLRGLREA